MVSFCCPLFPILFLLVGVWMIVQGIQLKPYISLATAILPTVAPGPENLTAVVFVAPTADERKVPLIDPPGHSQRDA